MAGALTQFEEDTYGIKTQPIALSGLTALAGGGQAGATLLRARVNEVTTVATAADSVILPTAVPGTRVWVINDGGAQSMNVFPDSGSTINALAANAAFAMAPNARVEFVCATKAKWFTSPLVAS